MKWCNTMFFSKKKECDFTFTSVHEGATSVREGATSVPEGVTKCCINETIKNSVISKFISNSDNTNVTIMEFFKKKSQSMAELFKESGSQEKDIVTKNEVECLSRSSNSLFETTAQENPRRRKLSEQFEQLDMYQKDYKSVQEDSELPQGSYNFGPLLRERNFRHKLNAEKRILRELGNPQLRAMQIAANQKAVAEIYKRANQNSISTSMLWPAKPSTSENTKKKDEGATDNDSWFSTSNKNTLDDYQRDRSLTMHSYFLKGKPEEKYPPAYWLTCTYRFLAEKACLHLVVRQTGTLPTIQGRLKAKVFIEHEKQVHKMVLAETSSDNAFRSHEFDLPCLSEPVGKVLVFRLNDIRNAFNKKFVGEWRILLDKCSEKAKIEFEKFR